MRIKEISTREEIGKTLAVFLQTREEISQEDYVEKIFKMMERGYRMAAIFEEDIRIGQCFGFIGVCVIYKLQYGKVLEIEDFMIDREKFCSGAEEILLRWAIEKAASLECVNIIGDLETKQKELQKIFSQEKFILDGFVFRKSC